MNMNFDEYLVELQEASSSLPDSAYEYARDSSHYDLSSHSSLHDAWLEYVKIKERSSGARSEIRSTEIELCFLGPFHDKLLFLSYGGVLSYRVSSSEVNHGHGDLDTHAFKASPEGNALHELLFHGDTSIRIEFTEFSYREEET